MTRNEGNLDRILRAIIGAVLIVAWWLGWMSGTLALVLGMIGAVLVVTGLFGFCPLYAALGINTRSAE